MTGQLCGCGQPLHYSNPASEAAVQRFVDELGETIILGIAGSADRFKVPRHFVALHGVAAVEVAELAAQYGWERA